MKRLRGYQGYRGYNEQQGWTWFFLNLLIPGYEVTGFRRLHGYRIAKSSIYLAISTGNVTSFAGNVNLLLPSWISWPWAWFEAFWEILWNHFHPERVVSFKERAERGWKSGARSLSWKSGWKPCTLATTRSWIYPKTFFRFRERSNWKFP